MVEAAGCQDDEVDEDDEDDDEEEEVVEEEEEVEEEVEDVEVEEEVDDDLEDDLSLLVDGSCLVSTRGGGGLTGLLAGSSLDQSSRDWFLGGGGGFPGLTVT